MAVGVSPDQWVGTAVSITLTPDPNEQIPALANRPFAGRLTGVSEYGAVLEIVYHSNDERDVSVLSKGRFSREASCLRGEVQRRRSLR